MKNITALLKKSKERHAQGLFVAEGTRLVSGAPREWLREVYVSESYAAQETGRQVLRQLGIFSIEDEENSNEPRSRTEEIDSRKDIKCQVLSESLFAKISDTRTPQGILALAQMPSYSLMDCMAQMPLLLILEDLQDPGNLGTILRTAEAAGVTGIIASRDTVDLYNPKTVRGTMGSIYRMPYVVTEDLHETLRQLRAAGVRIYAAHLQGAVDYDVPDYCGPVGFLIGNEGSGLTAGTAALAEAMVRIPMQG